MSASHEFELTLGEQFELLFGFGSGYFHGAFLFTCCFFSLFPVFLLKSSVESGDRALSLLSGKPITVLYVSAGFLFAIFSRGGIQYVHPEHLREEGSDGAGVCLVLTRGVDT